MTSPESQGLPADATAAPPMRSVRNGRRWLVRALVLVIFLVIGAACLWVMNVSIIAFDVPDVGEPFDVQAFRALTIPDDENAFTHYRAAALKLTDKEPLFANDSKRWAAMWTSHEEALKNGWSAANDDLRQWLEANHAALELWKQGTELPDALENPTGTLDIYTNSSTTQSLRDFMRLALLEAVRLSDAGQPRESWTWHRAVLRSGRHAGMHSVIIGRVMGVGIQMVGTEAVLRWGAQNNVTADDLRAALADVRAIEKMTAPLSDCLKAEYISTSNTILAMKSQAGIDSALSLPIIGGVERERRLQNLIFANWLRQADRHSFERKLTEKDDLTLFALDPNASDDPQLVPPEKIDKWFHSSLSRFNVPMILLSLSVFPISHELDAMDKERAYQAALELGLALELYHREHGEFPETLEPLLKGYVDSIPADPFGKGEPMHYRREPGPHGEAFLWSVWLDRADQEGRIEFDEKHPEQTGYDKVFHIAAPSNSPK